MKSSQDDDSTAVLEVKIVEMKVGEGEGTVFFNLMMFVHDETL